jgi:hypothetical protein
LLRIRISKPFLSKTFHFKRALAAGSLTVEPLTLPATRRDRPVAGGMPVLTSALLFSGVGALVKAASVDLPSEVVVFFRNAVAIWFRPFRFFGHGKRRAPIFFGCCA